MAAAAAASKAVAVVKEVDHVPALLVEEVAVDSIKEQDVRLSNKVVTAMAAAIAMEVVIAMVAAAAVASVRVLLSAATEKVGIEEAAMPRCARTPASHSSAVAQSARAVSTRTITRKTQAMCLKCPKSSTRKPTRRSKTAKANVKQSTQYHLLFVRTFDPASFFPVPLPLTLISHHNLTSTTNTTPFHLQLTKLLYFQID